MNRLITKMFLSVFGFLLVFPHTLIFSQCNMSQDPAPKIDPGAPGQRLCCAIGTHSGIDPTNLTGHKYGHQGNFFPQTAGTYVPTGEPLGYLYTGGAGFVDLGHVRDNADMVLYVYVQLLDGQHTVYTSGGDVVGVPHIPTAKVDMIGLAGAIVFVNSWAHELLTWGSGTNIYTSSKAEDFSAFSPEDMSSNIVGIYVAGRAINDMTAGINSPAADFPKQFNSEMDALLPMIIASLKPVKADDTTNLLNRVIKLGPASVSKADLTGIWWMDDVISPGNTSISLLRRNFDGEAWKITGVPDAPETIETPAWLSTTRFNNYYPQFLYVVGDNPKKPGEKSDVDATLVPKTNTHALEARFAPLGWVPTPAEQRLDPDVVQRDGSADPLCLATPKGVPITSGQFTPVKVNVYPPPPQDVMWSFTHATDFLRKNFTAVNPNMDGPMMYVPPNIPRPTK